LKLKENYVLIFDREMRRNVLGEPVTIIIQVWSGTGSTDCGEGSRLGDLEREREE